MLRTVCRNPWCKATFDYKEEDMVLVDSDDMRESKIDGILDETKKVPPHQCPKCRSFNNELSDGVSWREKRYEGSRLDGMAHPISIKINKFF